MAVACILVAKPAHSSPETYAGVDFYPSDRLRMPEYGLCKNLVQNPGFEMGLRYWGVGPLGRHTESKFKEYYLVDDTVSYEGHRSLKILGDAGQSPAHLSTFAIPVVAGDTYTLSFYAKADRTFVYLNSLVQTAQWGTFAVPFKDFRLTTDWQRYSVSFTAPNGVVAADFGLDKPPSDCTAWVDCVQIERGALTDYAEKPYQFAFVTNRRDNLFDSAERTGARIEISGKPMATGTLTVNATGTLGEPVHSSTEKFTLDPTGHAVIPEPWADNSPMGITVVETDIATADGFRDREFARLSRMRLLHSPYPNRQLFAFGGVNSRISDWDRRFNFYYEIGLGSCIHFDPQPPTYKVIYEKLGILSESSIFDGGDHMLGWNLKDDFLQHLSDDDLAKIEDAAYKKSAANPDITYWKLINEPDGTHAEAPRKLLTDVDQMKKYMTILAAARRGILRANPHAVLLSPDPAGMSDQTGIRWLDTFIKAGGLKVADLIAVHPYRQRPEDPDLDEDTSKLFTMLDRDGYHGDVWYTEGGGTSRMNIPAYGLNVYKTLGADTYRAGQFTYDVGWAEKLSTAYCIRQWLVGLKYHRRLKQYVDWYLSGDSVIDQDGTPGLIAYAPNTLGNLLGDATYVRDIALGNNIRSYLFKDRSQRPVIALWTYDLQGDHGEKTGPTLNIKLLPKGSSAWNMVGDNVNLSYGKLTLGPLPIFLRGPAGTEAKFSHAVESAPMLTGGNSLRIWPQFDSLIHATIMLQNVTRNPVSGELVISQEGNAPPHSQQIDIAPNRTFALPIALSASAGGLFAKASFHPADGGGVRDHPLPLSSDQLPSVHEAAHDRWRPVRLARRQLELWSRIFPWTSRRQSSRSPMVKSQRRTAVRKTYRLLSIPVGTRPISTSRRMWSMTYSIPRAAPTSRTPATECRCFSIAGQMRHRIRIWGSTATIRGSPFGPDRAEPKLTGLLRPTCRLRLPKLAK